MPLTTHRPIGEPAQAAHATGLCQGVWLSPAGVTSGGGAARFQGPVDGAWGGRCEGRGEVDAGSGGFHAELALTGGNAVNAAIAAGGHRREWLRLDDPGSTPRAWRSLDLLLSLTGELQCDGARHRGWGADPAGSAFVGSEDAGGEPLVLTLRLDPLQPGAVAAQARHRIELRNGAWTPLPLRFATRIQASLGQPMHWVVQAYWALAAPPGTRVAYRCDCDAGPVPRVSSRSVVTRRST